MNALEDRGLFWSSETDEAAGPKFPATASSGAISISAAGQIKLELDTTLDLGELRSSTLGDGRLPESILIYGRLKKLGHSVVLIGGFRNGHVISSYFPENEKYICDYIIVFRTSIETFPHEVSLAEMRVSLEGFEEWIRSEAVTVSIESDGSYSALYAPEKDIVFEIADGTLVIRSTLADAQKGTSHLAELRHIVNIEMRFKQSVTPKKANVFWSQLRDFLILVTNAEKTLKQPSVKIEGWKHWVAFYALDAQAGEEHPSDLKCAVRWSEIKHNFGVLFQQWRENRELYGPGYYLYFGVRRGQRLFVEHRFANMMWGLEPLSLAPSRLR